MNKLCAITSAIILILTIFNLYLLANISNKTDTSSVAVEQILQSRDDSNSMPSTNQILSEAEELVLEDELKKLEDIDIRIQTAGNSIENIGNAISEIDLWLFPPENQVEAIQKLEKLVIDLAKKIETKIRILLDEALASPNGEAAQMKMAEINQLLSYYPTPASNDQRLKLNQITSSVLATSKKIEELRRLRYNKWAIKQIKNELISHRKLIKVGGIDDLKKVFVTDKDNVLKNCVYYLKVIDPALLEPSVLDLYNHAYGLTRDALSNDDSRLIKLAEGLSNLEARRGLESF